MLKNNIFLNPLGKKFVMERMLACLTVCSLLGIWLLKVGQFCSVGKKSQPSNHVLLFMLKNVSL